MNRLDRLIARRRAWEREIERGGMFADAAPGIIADLDIQISELARATAKRERVQ